MKIGNQQILYMNALEDISGAKAKNCVIFPDHVAFLVRENQMGLAIGKNGETIRNLRKKIGKNVEVIEWNDSPKEFLSKAIMPVKALGVELEGNIAILRLDSENRRKMQESMGRLRRIKEIMKNTYDVSEIRVK